jgi:hypothetical protein
MGVVIGTAGNGVANGSGEWTCALIRCGTSRAMVMSAEQLPFGEQQGIDVLRRRIGGSAPGAGLAGAHYQQNKVAVVAPARGGPTFRFRFFQFDERHGELTSNLECANVAAAAALFGLLARIAEFDAAGRVHGFNEGTGQWMTFEPDRTAEPWDTTCSVRFVYAGGLRVPVFSGFEPLRPLAPACPVDVWIAQHGNVFVLADLEPHAATPDLISALAVAGAEIGPRLGADTFRAAHAKILTYHVDAVGKRSIHAHSMCFYHGQAHTSLPGSGAMFLAVFLVRQLAEELDLGPETRAVGVHLTHPSGVLSVKVEIDSDAGGLRVRATEFRTPVKLLVWGVGPPT